MTLRLVANLCICVCTGISFFYGFLRCLGRPQPLFLKSVIGAMGCMMGGRLFSVVLQLCGGQNVTRLNLGYLGVLGCFLFICSSNYSEIQTYATVIKKKYAIIFGVLALVPIIVLNHFIFCSDATIQYKILGLIVSIAVMSSAAYLFVYMILPDSGNGFMNMFRPYSIVALTFSYSQLGEIYFTIQENRVMLIITYVFICICGLITVPLLERRYNKWKKRRCE